MAKNLLKIKRMMTITIMEILHQVEVLKRKSVAPVTLKAFGFTKVNTNKFLHIR